MLEYKRLCSYYWKENIEDPYLREFCHIFQALTHNFHMDSMACNMEGHIKLMTDSLVPPIDSSIVFHIHLRNRHQPNRTSCVLFVLSTQFYSCNMHSVKKGSNSVKGPSEVWHLEVSLISSWLIYNNLPATHGNYTYTITPLGNTD